MAKEINFFQEQETPSLVPRGTARGIEWEKKQEKLLQNHTKRIIEALLFASSVPISLDKIREVTDSFHPFKPKVIQELLQELKEEYLTQQRAFRIEEIADGYLLRTFEEYRPYIEHLYRNKRTEKLSQAALEVLAIIAYRQPVTRPQIDAVRGVDCSGTLQALLERELIESVGKLEAPGRPSLYSVTSHFMQHFGLKTLADLPSVAKSESSTQL